MVHTKYDYEYTTDEINAFIKLNHCESTQDILSDENIQDECLDDKYIKQINVICNFFIITNRDSNKKYLLKE